jgi:hypothetical protein
MKYSTPIPSGFVRNHGGTILVPAALGDALSALQDEHVKAFKQCLLDAAANKEAADTAEACPPPEEPDDAPQAGCKPFRVIVEPKTTTGKDFYQAAEIFDDRVRRTSMANYMAKRGNDRWLAPLPKNWRESLVRIATEMPNFMETVEILRAEFCLAELDDGFPRLPPLLLMGTPGIGKSVFAEAIAALLGTGYFRFQMESAATSAELGGSSTYWGNTRTGLVFESLVGGVYANPVFLIDEIDKPPQPLEHTSPYATLLSLWQEESARQFTDASMPDIVLDASRVNWLATANELKPIPAPVLSRTLVLHVPPLTREQSLRVVSNLFAATVAGLKLDFKPLGEGIAEKLAKQSPRVVKRVLRTAIGRACFHQRDHLVADDLLQWQIPSYQATGAGNDQDA